MNRPNMKAVWKGSAGEENEASGPREEENNLYVLSPKPSHEGRRRGVGGGSLQALYGTNSPDPPPGPPPAASSSSAADALRKRTTTSCAESKIRHHDNNPKDAHHHPPEQHTERKPAAAERDGGRFHPAHPNYRHPLRGPAGRSPDEVSRPPNGSKRHFSHEYPPASSHQYILDHQDGAAGVAGPAGTLSRRRRPSYPSGDGRESSASHGFPQVSSYSPSPPPPLSSFSPNESKERKVSFSVRDDTGRAGITLQPYSPSHTHAHARSSPPRRGVDPSLPGSTPTTHTMPPFPASSSFSSSSSEERRCSTRTDGTPFSSSQGDGAPTRGHSYNSVNNNSDGSHGAARLSDNSETTAVHGIGHAMATNTLPHPYQQSAYYSSTDVKDRSIMPGRTRIHETNPPQSSSFASCFPSSSSSFCSGARHNTFAPFSDAHYRRKPGGWAYNITPPPPPPSLHYIPLKRSSAPITSGGGGYPSFPYSSSSSFLYSTHPTSSMVPEMRTSFPLGTKGNRPLPPRLPLSTAPPFTTTTATTSSSSLAHPFSLTRNQNDQCHENEKVFSPAGGEGKSGCGGGAPSPFRPGVPVAKRESLQGFPGGGGGGGGPHSFLMPAATTAPAPAPASPLLSHWSSICPPANKSENRSYPSPYSPLHRHDPGASRVLTGHEFPLPILPSPPTTGVRALAFQLQEHLKLAQPHIPSFERTRENIFGIPAEDVPVERDHGGHFFPLRSPYHPKQKDHFHHHDDRHENMEHEEFIVPAYSLLNDWNTTPAPHQQLLAHPSSPVPFRQYVG